MHPASDTTRPAHRRAAVLPGLTLAICAALAPACMFSIGETRSAAAPRLEKLCVAEGKSYSTGALYSFPAGTRVCRAGTWEEREPATEATS